MTDSPERSGQGTLSDETRRFIAARRVAHLATASADAVPHVVPVCFALAAHALYITIDEKPKRERGSGLRRLRNIAENPSVAVVVDRYDDDWSLLGWVLLRGRATMLVDGAEHDVAQRLLRERYSQLASMRIADLPVIAIAVDRVTTWGNLSI